MLKALKSWRPDGEEVHPDHVVRAKRRSTFDALFDIPGTYKVSVNGKPSYWTRYKDTAGERHWLAADKLARGELLPEGATQVSTSLSYTRAESYITLGAPSAEALAIEGTYLEILPVTHPADLIAGEPAEFELLLEGKPLADTKVELTAEGSQYRDALDPLSATTDDKGRFVFTPEKAGRYLLKAHYNRIGEDPRADKHSLNVHLTLEFQLPINSDSCSVTRGFLKPLFYGS